MRIKMNIRLVLTVIIIWVLFSLLYGYAAFNKPFHVDEFYSWVYTERCNYSEILHLRDGGIGHPPLYHIAQKTVQTFVRPYNFINVRLANYFFGSLFVIALSLLLFRNKCHPVFIAAACLSATVIDCFIFSRMWGLVGLVAVLLVSSGERYCEEGGIKNLAAVLFLCITGLCADYAFVLLLPYTAIILLSDKKYFCKMLFACFSISIVLFVLFNMYKVMKKMSGGYYDFVYHLLRELKNAAEEMMVLLFDFNYIELFLFGILFFSVIVITAIYNKYWKENTGSISGNAPVKRIFLILRNIFSRDTDIKLKTPRLILSISCALMILLVLNPFMWRDLLSKRFLFTLYPLLLLLLSRNLNVPRLHAISAIILLTVILYIPSNKVMDYYPPPAVVEARVPVMFHDEISYSTHYLKVDCGRNITPVLFDFSKYEMYCRICKMGSSEFNFDKYNEIRMVGREDFRSDGILPAEYSQVAAQPNLSRFDRFLYSRLTPMYPRYFCVYTFRRIIE